MTFLGSIFNHDYIEVHIINIVSNGGQGKPGNEYSIT